MIKQAMILAAGRGKRMMPLTKDMPKSMLKIGNMTLIEDKIVRLTEAGVERIIINTGYLGEYIRDHVGDGSKYGINIVISDEGLMPIGTANGIRIMLEKFNNEPFILVNADIWTNYLFIDLRNELIDNTDPRNACSYKQESITVSISVIERDCDGDGVTNAKEALDKTDPLDGWGFIFSSVSTETSDAWKALDCDGDGVLNGNEIKDGTDVFDRCNYGLNM